MSKRLEEWNVVATAQEGRFRQAWDVLDRYGPVSGTDYFNVLVTRVEDPAAFLADLSAAADSNPEALAALGRVAPVTATFRFQSPREFENLAREVVTSWLPDLAGITFHVRMHRRGFKGRLSSQEEEQFLDAFILERTEAAGRPARISFDDPDVIVAVETVGQQAGLALWRRGDLARYPFLGLD